MKTIDQCRRSCRTFILIDLVLLIPGIIVATFFPSSISDISIFANPLTLPIALGFMLFLDIAVLRWLIQLSVEIDDARRERSMKVLRTVYDAQQLVHIVVIAAIAGSVAGRLGLFPEQ